MGRKPEGKAEKMFKNLGKKIDGLLADLSVLKDQAKEEYAENIEELKRNASTIKEGVGNFKNNHKEQIKEVETSLKNAGKELRNAFEVVFTQKRN